VKRKIIIKVNWQEFYEFDKLYKKQQQFPPLPNPYTDKIQPISHTGYLMFVRNKFLFRGIKASFKNKNLYASYALLKSYWENSIAFGYYIINISQHLKSGNKEYAFKLSRKMALGGRGFVTERMARNKGKTLKDFTLPSIATMMNAIDNVLKTKLKITDSISKELYRSMVAEGGHTTYIGLFICGRMLPNGSGLADIKKSWSKWEESQILNLVVMASKIFQIFWNRFENIRKNYQVTP